MNWTRGPRGSFKQVSTWSVQVNSFNNRLFTIILHNRKKKKVRRRHTLRHSLTAEMRSAALKAGGSEALPESRLPGNCCYATAESPPIKAQRAAGRGWTAARRSKHLWGATLSNHKADKKAGKQRAWPRFRFCPAQVRAADDASRSPHPALLCLLPTAHGCQHASKMWAEARPAADAAGLAGISWRCWWDHGNWMNRTVLASTPSNHLNYQSKSIEMSTAETQILMLMRNSLPPRNLHPPTSALLMQPCLEMHPPPPPLNMYW